MARTKGGGELFSKDFLKNFVYNETLTNYSEKKFRKPIQWTNINWY